jgi:hypothetical protein
MSKKYHQGRYQVKNPKKYWGDFNNVIFRSSWELKVFIWCDTNPDVVRWNSEEVVIPYVNPFDGKYHRYFTDIYVEIMKNGKLEKYVYEIKPNSEKKPPKKPKRRTRAYANKLKTYLINQAKWESAAKYCKERNLKFQILTEKELGIT